MGVRGFTKFITTRAPNTVKQQTAAAFSGSYVAVDIATSLYAFLVAIRNSDGYDNLTDKNDETTSHISGILHRCLRFIECGLKPIFVFDGKPPDLKATECARRHAIKEKALQDLEAAKESGDMAQISKLKNLSVRLEQHHLDEVKVVLNMLGVPVIQSRTEAEAECAFLCRRGKCSIVFSEDSDTLCYGAPHLARKVKFSGSNLTYLHYNYKAILDELQLTDDQFIDLCMLLGTDYAENIKGVGPVSAFNYIKKYGSIEKIAENDPLFSDYLSLYRSIKNQFVNPDVLTDQELSNYSFEFNPMKKEELFDYLVNRRNFNETRINNYIDRFEKATKKSQQPRLDGFFTISKTIRSLKPQKTETKVTKTVKSSQTKKKA